MIHSVRGLPGQSTQKYRTLYYALGLIGLTTNVASITYKIFDRFGFFPGASSKRILAAYCLTGCLDFAIFNRIGKVPLKSNLLYVAAIIMPLARISLLILKDSGRTSSEVTPEVTPVEKNPLTPLPMLFPEERAYNIRIVQAADWGDPDALYLAACLFAKGGAGVEVDVERSDYYFARAAGVGHPQSLHARESVYQCGIGHKGVNEEHAYICFLHAARQGHPMAQYETGLCYKHGIGVEKHSLKALIYFILAQEHVKAAKVEVDNLPFKVDAQFKYGLALKLWNNDKVLESNFWEVLHLFRTSEHSKAAGMLYLVGKMYNTYGEDYDDLFTAQCYARARQSYEIASTLGHGLASLRVGSYFELGKGVHINMSLALRYYFIAMNQGCDRGNDAFLGLIDRLGLARMAAFPQPEIPELVS